MFDLNSVAGVEYALNVAIRARDRDTFTKLYAKRKSLLATKRGSASGSTPLLREMQSLIAQIRAESAAADQLRVGAFEDYARGTRRPAARRGAPNDLVDFDDDDFELLAPDDGNLYLADGRRFVL